MYEFIPELMREASKIMLSAHDIDNSIDSKSGEANFVTAYDVAVQNFLMTEMSIGLSQAERWYYMTFVSKPPTLTSDAVND